MSTKWSIRKIAAALSAGLATDSRRLDAEQAVRGIDSLDELALHPLLAAGLISAGFGVHREERYPGDRGHRRASEGERCDLVLTPAGRPLDAPDRLRSLFDPPDAVALADAFWLEIKVVAQFTSAGPNRRYSSQLLGDVRRDVAKLAKDPGIRHAGLAIILFAADRHTAEHDLNAWQTRSLEFKLPILRRTIHHTPLADRLGNTLCTAAVFLVGQFRE